MPVPYKPTYEDLEKRIKSLEEEMIKVKQEKEDELALKEAFFEAQLEASIDGIIVVNEKQEVVLANKRAFWMAGDIPFPDELHNIDSETFVQQLASKTKNPEQFLKKTKFLIDHPSETCRDEVEFINGTIIDRYTSPITGKNGQCHGRIWILKDITKRKNAEKALRKSEATLRSVFKATPVGLCIMKDRVFLDVNKTWLENLGYSETEIIGHTPRLLYENDEEYARVGRELFTNLLECGLASVQTVHRRKNGELRDAILTAVPLQSEDGYLGMEVVSVEDITERKRASEELENSERFLSNIVENMPDMIFVKDARELRFVRFNRAGEKLLGYPRDMLIGKNDYDFFPENEADFFTTKDRDVLSSKQPIDIPEETIQTGHEGEKILHTKKIPILDKDGTPQYLLGIAEDITERKRGEKEHMHLVMAIEQAAEAVFICEPDGTIRYVNPVCKRMTGYEKDEIIGQPLQILKSDKHDEAFFRNIGDTISNGEVWSGRITNKRKDGTLYEVEVTVSPVRDNSGAITSYVSIHRDITNEVVLEKSLRQAQKMEALGTLAGGIAHDFNNILSAIIGYTQLSQFKVPEGSLESSYLGQVLTAGARAKDLVSQILTFSRQQELERKPILIAPLIKEGIKMLRSSIPSTIRIKQVVSETPMMIFADPTQIHQVLMNLCTNAAHAMQEKGGILDIQLVPERVVRDKPLQPLVLMPGDYAKLTVSDTGCGIDSSVMDKIFDPFFTTKSVGEGTGLGLSVVYGIVRDQNGAIDISSEPGKGTTVTVYFPLTETEKIIQEDMPERISGGNERILFVDDEATLVELGNAILTSLGYHVTTRTSSIEALEAFRSRPHDFDLVITDMTMPNMRGDHLAKELLKIKQDLPIVLCTGFSEILSEARAKDIGIRGFIMKPITVKDIAKAVRDVLDK